MIKLLLVGDIAIGEYTKNKGNPKDFFANVKHKLREYNLVIANLESPIAHCINVYTSEKPYLCSIPELGTILKDADVDVILLSNNHIMDQGVEGLVDSLLSLEKNNIIAVGAGRNIKEATKGAIVQLNNGCKIGILGFSHGHVASGSESGCAPIDMRVMLSALHNIRAKADFLIVYLHEGLEFFPYPNRQTIRMCHSLVRNGAGLIFCSHAHVVCGYEIYMNAPIFYGLGNFGGDLTDNRIINDAFKRSKLIKYGFDCREVNPKTGICVEVELKDNFITNIDILPTGVDCSLRPIFLNKDESFYKYMNALNEPIRNRYSKKWNSINRLWNRNFIEFIFHHNLTYLIKKIKTLRLRHIKAIFRNIKT